MTTFRDQKREARKDLHEALREPVYYLLDEEADPLLVTARLHIDFTALGELRRIGFAEREELTPRAIFMRDEVVPVRGAVIVSESMGAYYIDQTDPPDDITTKVRISRLPAGKYASWGLTFGADWGGLTAPV